MSKLQVSVSCQKDKFTYRYNEQTTVNEFQQDILAKYGIEVHKQAVWRLAKPRNLTLLLTVTPEDRQKTLLSQLKEEDKIIVTKRIKVLYGEINFYSLCYEENTLEDLMKEIATSFKSDLNNVVLWLLTSSHPYPTIPNNTWEERQRPLFEVMKGFDSVIVNTKVTVQYREEEMIFSFDGSSTVKHLQDKIYEKWKIEKYRQCLGLSRYRTYIPSNTRDDRHRKLHEVLKDSEKIVVWKQVTVQFGKEEFPYPYYKQSTLTEMQDKIDRNLNIPPERQYLWIRLSPQSCSRDGASSFYQLLNASTHVLVKRKVSLEYGDDEFVFTYDGSTTLRHLQDFILDKWKIEKYSQWLRQSSSPDYLPTTTKYDRRKKLHDILRDHDKILVNKNYPDSGFKKDHWFRLASWDIGSYNDANHSEAVKKQLPRLFDDKRVDLIALQETQVETFARFQRNYNIIPLAQEDFLWAPAYKHKSWHYGCAVATARSRNTRQWTMKECVSLQQRQQTLSKREERFEISHHMVNVEMEFPLDKGSMKINVVSLCRPHKEYWATNRTACETFDQNLRDSAFGTRRSFGQFIIICGDFNATFGDEGDSNVSIKSIMEDSGMFQVNKLEKSELKSDCFTLTGVRQNKRYWKYYDFIFIPFEYTPCIVQRSAAHRQYNYHFGHIDHSLLMFDFDLKIAEQLKTVFSSIPRSPNSLIRVASRNLSRISNEELRKLIEYNNQMCVTALQEIKLQDWNELNKKCGTQSAEQVLTSSNCQLSPSYRRGNNDFVAGSCIIARLAFKLQPITLNNNGKFTGEHSVVTVQFTQNIVEKPITIKVVSLCRPFPHDGESNNQYIRDFYDYIQYTVVGPQRKLGDFVLVCCDWCVREKGDHLFLRDNMKVLKKIMERLGLMSATSFLKTTSTDSTYVGDLFLPKEFSACLEGPPPEGVRSTYYIDLVAARHLQEEFCQHQSFGFPRVKYIAPW